MQMKTQGELETCPYCAGQGEIPTQAALDEVKQSMVDAGLTRREICTPLGIDPALWTRPRPEKIKLPWWLRIWQAIHGDEGNG